MVLADIVHFLLFVVLMSSAAGCCLVASEFNFALLCPLCVCARFVMEIYMSCLLVLEETNFKLHEGKIAACFPNLTPKFVKYFLYCLTSLPVGLQLSVIFQNNRLFMGFRNCPFVKIIWNLITFRLNWLFSFNTNCLFVLPELS